MFGDKIRMIRINRGLTQETVAQQLGIGQNVYSKIETNQSKISEDLLIKIAQIYGVTVDDLKNPDPVIITFNHSPQSNGINNGQVYAMNEKLLEQLTNQLNEKDKQIEKMQLQTQELISQLKIVFQKS